MHYQILSLLCALLLCLSASAQAPDSATALGNKAFRRIELQQTAEVPFGYKFDGYTFGGISALAHVSADKYYALSDDRGYIQSPRFFTIELKDNQIKVTGVTTLKKKGAPFKPQIIDPEGIVVLPWGNVLISTEPDLKTKPSIPARIIEFTSGGEFVRDIVLPEFATQTTDKSGPRNNKGFEGLSLSPDRKKLVAAFESSLMQDGEPASFDKGSKNRILQFQVDAQKRTITYLNYVMYPTESVFKSLKTAESRGNGISEIAMLDDDLVFVLERSTIYSKEQGFGNHVRIFEFSLKNYEKLLVFDSNTFVSRLPNGKVDNQESMVFGKEVSPGLFTLLLASDNNFNPLQKNLFLIFTAYKKGLPPEGKSSSKRGKP